MSDKDWPRFEGTYKAGDVFEWPVCRLCGDKINEGETNHGTADFPICEKCMQNEISMGLDDELLWED